MINSISINLIKRVKEALPTKFYLLFPTRLLTFYFEKYQAFRNVGRLAHEHLDSPIVSILPYLHDHFYFCASLHLHLLLFKITNFYTIFKGYFPLKFYFLDLIRLLTFVDYSAQLCTPNCFSAQCKRNFSALRALW